MDRLWKTTAHWPDGMESTDDHPTESAAVAVARTLLREGNSLGKPLSVDVEFTPDPDSKKTYK